MPLPGRVGNSALPLEVSGFKFNYYGMIFVSSNLTEGWYYQDVYYEEDGDMLQTGTFYSYGNSSDFTVTSIDAPLSDWFCVKQNTMGLSLL